MEKLISIIVPCYNVEEYLQRCLQSICEQTYQYWEAICIDDGSTDATYDILSDFAKKDTRIKCFTQANKGVSETRNRALSLSQGEYICFVDSDDIIEKSYLDILLKSIQSVDLSVCTFTRKMSSTETNKNCSSSSTRFSQNEFIVKLIYDKTFRPQIWCMLFKSAIIKENHITFYPNCARGEDREFFMKYIAYSESIIYTPIPLYYYRINPNSAMASFNTKSLTSIEAAQRTADFYTQIAHPSSSIVKLFFYYTIWKYVILSLLKHQCSIYTLLEKDYNLKEVMYALKKYPDSFVRLSARLYRISKFLFQTTFSTVGYLYCLHNR